MKEDFTSLALAKEDFFFSLNLINTFKRFSEITFEHFQHTSSSRVPINIGITKSSAEVRAVARFQNKTRQVSSAEGASR